MPLSSKAEENLIKEKEKFEALFQYASLGILVVNARAEITMVNNFGLSLFGYINSEELLGKKIEHLIPQRFHDHHTNYRNQYNQHPSPRPMGIGRDLYALRKDGTEFPVEISLSNYSTNEGKFAIAFVSDISKRKENELAVLQQKEQLAEINSKIEDMNNMLEQKVELRTQQLQETLGALEKSKDELTAALSKEKELSDLKSRFVSMASHEFRTPLSTILSSASLVAKYTETTEQDKRDKHINRIKSSVNNLTDILNEFLSLGRIEDGKVLAHYSEFNISENIEAICHEMQTHAKPGQQLVYRHKGNPIVTLDPALLRNIMLNLLSNAIKFSAADGLIEVGSSVDENNISIAVQDHGIGISTKDQEHLFERFFRASNAINIQGTGLGLHIVSKYAELMNGEISFKSELEKGTQLVITFPVKKL